LGDALRPGIGIEDLPQTGGEEESGEEDGGEEDTVPLAIARERFERDYVMATLKRNHGKVKKTLDMLDAARRDGIDVETDVYPYNAFSNMFLPCLFLREPGVENEIIFLDLKHFPEFEGRTFADFMRERKQNLRAAAFELARREGATKIPVAGEMMSEDDVRYVMAHPLTSIGSDGVENPGGKAHPRLVGTTVRVIEK